MFRFRALLLTACALAMVATSAGAAGAKPAAARGGHPYSSFLRHGYMVGDVRHYEAVKRHAARVAGVSLPAPRSGATKPTAKGFKGTYDTSGDPPDTTGAVGKRVYVEGGNSAMAVY